MLAVGGELGAGAAIHGVGAGGRFRQCVGSDHLARREARQIFFLLIFGAEVNDRQQTDAAVRSPRGGEAGIFRNVIGDDGGGDFVHFEAAIGFGDFDAGEA